MQQEGSGSKCQGPGQQLHPPLLGRHIACAASGAAGDSAAAAGALPSGAADLPSPGGPSPVQCAQQPAAERPRYAAYTPVQCAQAQPALHSPALVSPAHISCAQEPDRELHPPVRPAVAGQPGAAADQDSLCDVLHLPPHQASARQASPAAEQEPAQVQYPPACWDEAGKASTAAEQLAASAGQPAQVAEAPLGAGAEDAPPGTSTGSDSSDLEDDYAGNRQRHSWQPAPLSAAAARELRASQQGSQRCALLPFLEALQ